MQCTVQDVVHAEQVPMRLGRGVRTAVVVHVILSDNHVQGIVGDAGRGAISVTVCDAFQCVACNWVDHVH